MALIILNVFSTHRRVGGSLRLLMATGWDNRATQCGEARTTLCDDPLPLNQRVAGSSPAAPTKNQCLRVRVAAGFQLVEILSSNTSSCFSPQPAILVGSCRRRLPLVALRRRGFARRVALDHARRDLVLDRDRHGVRRPSQPLLFLPGTRFELIVAVHRPGHRHGFAAAVVSFHRRHERVPGEKMGAFLMRVGASLLRHPGLGNPSRICGYETSDIARR